MSPADGVPSSPVAAEAGDRAPFLYLNGFEGPLDLLLELARAQKIDLSGISILTLVEQYLTIVESARKVRMELAADWLVMAAWLAWLKSRLLLPAEENPDTETLDAAELLQERLEELARMNSAARWLNARQQVGRDVFLRGEAEHLVEIDRSELSLDVPQLLRAYMAAVRRTAKRRVYTPRLIHFWTVQDALTRLRRLLGSIPPGWSSLDVFLPETLPGIKNEADLLHARRAAMAGTLLAGLELARSGSVQLKQEEAFGSIMLRQQDEPDMNNADTSQDGKLSNDT